MLGALLDRLGLGRHEPLGKVLVRSRVITEEQLRAALEVQRATPRERLGRIVVDKGFASEYDVLQAIAKNYRVSATALSDDFAALIESRAASWREKLMAMRVPIRIKLSIAITFMIWVTILTLSIVILARQRDRLYAQTMRTGTVSLNYFANDAAVPLLEDDTLRLNGLIKESASVEGLAYASIVGRNGVVLAHTDLERIGAPAPPLAAESSRTQGQITSRTYRGADGAHLMNISRPVAYAGTVLGEANVGISLDFIDTQIRRETLTIAVLSLFIVLLGISIAILIGVGFARPISRLVLATQEIGKGNFQYRIERVRGDEFGDLASAFNYMSHELWKKLVMAKSFGSYVSPEILEMVMAQAGGNLLGGRRMDVTVVFTDIRGFTAFAEATDPERVVEAINEYFEIATRHIHQQGGYVDKFIGDAVLGVFGAPIARSDHAARALRASVAMQHELLAQDAARNPLLAKVGIGINSGVAVAGDLGSEVKRQYSVIGDCVNVASRLNALAAGGKTIISRSTREAVGEAVEVAALPPARVKGKTEPIEVFEVTGLRAAPGEAA
ncbi:MAG TPA: adenylate/guanylate cyclase domain-containing protein [Candidatus Methanoperedens sp.]|nr:adenylate/guanylate cyclase domain-containing protein [Candidatus Methanoperedens sp.]